MLAAEGFAELVRTTVIMSNQELSHCGRRTCGGHCACVRERANACGCAGGRGCVRALVKMLLFITPPAIFLSNGQEPPLRRPATAL